MMTPPIKFGDLFLFELYTNEIILNNDLVHRTQKCHCYQFFTNDFYLKSMTICQLSNLLLQTIAKHNQASYFWPLRAPPIHIEGPCRILNSLLLKVS